MSIETGGVTLSIEERIKQDAIQIAKDELDNSKPYPSWEYLIEKGALSERNKTIEEIREEIDKLDDWATIHLDDGEMIGFKRACSEIEEKLDSLTPKK